MSTSEEYDMRSAVKHFSLRNGSDGARFTSHFWPVLTRWNAQHPFSIRGAFLAGRFDNDPAITTAVLNSTAQHYEARSLLMLYGPEDVVSAGVTASAHVLQIDAAYQNFDRWKADLYRFKDRYAAAVKADLESMLHLSLVDRGAERISG